MKLMGLLTNPKKEKELAEKLVKRARLIASLTDTQLIMLSLSQMEDGCVNDQQIVDEFLERLPTEIGVNPNYE